MADSFPLIALIGRTARKRAVRPIGGGCFAITLARLRSRSAYQGQWSRLRFSVLAGASSAKTCESRGSSAADRENPETTAERGRSQSTAHMARTPP
ncbi:MAG: hypothetical protein ACMUIS_07490, partial [bacterium]